MRFTETLLVQASRRTLGLLKLFLLLLLPQANSSFAEARTNNFFIRESLDSVSSSSDRDTVSNGIDRSISQSSFPTECVERMLSAETTADGLISQHEFVTFLQDHCVDQGFCPTTTPSSSFRFHNLRVLLQLAFVSPICNNLAVNSLQCFRTLAELSGQEYGYTIQEENQEDVEREITQMCGYIYTLAKDNEVSGTGTGTETGSQPVSGPTTEPQPSSPSSPSNPSSGNNSPPSSPTGGSTERTEPPMTPTTGLQPSSPSSSTTTTTDEPVSGQGGNGDDGTNPPPTETAPSAANPLGPTIPPALVTDDSPTPGPGVPIPPSSTTDNPGGPTVADGEPSATNNETGMPTMREPTVPGQPTVEEPPTSVGGSGSPGEPTIVTNETDIPGKPTMGGGSTSNETRGEEPTVEGPSGPGRPTSTGNNTSVEPTSPGANGPAAPTPTITSPSDTNSSSSPSFNVTGGNETSDNPSTTDSSSSSSPAASPSLASASETTLNPSSEPFGSSLLSPTILTSAGGIDGDDDLAGSARGLSAVAIAGIAMGSATLVIFGVILVSQRRRRPDDGTSTLLT